MATQNNDFVPVQHAGNINAVGGDDTYIISPAWVTDNAEITITDAQGVNIINLIDGLHITSSIVMSDTARFVLSNGAVLTILGASGFTYAIGGNPLLGQPGTIQTYTEFVENTLGTTVPSTGQATGGDVTIGGGTNPGDTHILEGVVDGNVTHLALDTMGGDVTLVGAAGGTVIDGGTSGAQSLRLTGDASIRIDLTVPSNQVRGLDLNGNGLIAANGIENNLKNAGIMTVSNFEVFDAYARNPINETDHANNYFGDIAFDGTGFQADGHNTDGTVYLGGLGIDTAFGGIGNDFMTGGGVASGRYVATGNVDAFGNPIFTDTLTGLTTTAPQADTLSGGRNADFFFVELSALDPTDGNNININGGSTFDNPNQDRDWVLLEASDDNEPVTVNLGAGIVLPIGPAATIADVENLDASGDLYSFLNSFDAVLGGMRTFKSAHAADGTENSGLGSTGQLIVNGDGDSNIVIAGYDNDTINGAGNSDILFGGNLGYLLSYANNPNLIDANGGLSLNINSVGTVNDGRDTILGGAGSDSIVLEMDGGVYAGGAATGVTGAPVISGDNDILYATSFTMGRTEGHTAADELANGSAQAQADALAALTTDSKLRIDLGVGQGVMYRGYGGADTLNNEVAGQVFTADQTRYATGVARTTVQDIDGIITTGLGAIDYDADGSNDSDLSGRYQANYAGINADMDLRGVDIADIAGNFGYNIDGSLNPNHSAGDNTLYANTGNDVVEGRQGNDLLSGGFGHDDFVFNLNGGDDVDIVHRQVDANGDNIWDGTFSQDYRVLGDGQSADPSIVTYTINHAHDVVAVVFSLDGVAVTASGASVTSATSLAELVTAVNTIISGIDANLSASEAGGNLVITDASGRTFTSVTIAGDLGVSDFAASAVVDNGTPAYNTDEIDRIIFKSYANRNTNLGTLDQLATLGANAYAQDMVVGFEEDAAGNVTTTLAQGQQFDIQFQNLNAGDIVTVTVNGVNYTRTVAVGQDTTAFVTAFMNQINLNTLDLNTASGTIAAAQNDIIVTAGVDGIFGTIDDVDVASESVLQIIGDALVYMSAPVVTVVNPNGAAGTATVADVSNTSVELLGYDGRDNDLNEDTVLFVGNTGASTNYGRDTTDPTDISAGSDSSWSVLATALDAGGTLAGKNAILVDLNNDGVRETALHGDDLLIGAAGDDVINAGTGDDKIIGSAGTDTVNGGGNEAATVTVGGNYIDTLVFNESDFGAGTSFFITVGGIGAADTGTVAISGAATGTTTYTGIEQVSTYSNTADDTVSFAALSDQIAAITTAGATQTLRDMQAPEGVFFQMGGFGAGMWYTVDLNNNDALAATEINLPGSAVIGVENVVGGAANDTVVVEESQIGSSNNINLAGNANDEGALTVGQDTVQYDHTIVGWTAAQTPVVTLAVSNASVLASFTNGILGTATSTDTLQNVEVVDITLAALSALNTDTIDVSALNNAIVNYGAPLAVRDSLQANGNAADNTATLVDLAAIATGGVSVAGVGQGDEIVTITGVTLMERVTGGAGNDRVVVADNMQDYPVGTVAAATLDLGFASAFGDGVGNVLIPNDAPVQADVARNGLYQFNLGAGDGDMLDYTNEGGDVYVVLATNTTGADRIIVDGDADGDLLNNNLLIPDGDRIDIATGVERYIGSTVGDNIIDLSESTVATTIEFSREVTLNGSPSPMDHGNEFIDPDGFNGVNDTDMLGIEVRNTSDSTVYGRFMDDPATGSIWNVVVGNNQNETIILTDNETGPNHGFDLEGGANSVNYSALTVDTILQVIDTAVVGTNVASTYNSGVAIDDDIRIFRDQSGTLTVTGSGEDNDVIDISTIGAVVVNGHHEVNLTTQRVIEDATNTLTAPALAGNYSTTVIGFEDVIGSAVVDYITGNGQANIINAAAGNDRITGAGGADNLTGGANNDQFIYTQRTDGNTVGAAGTQNLTTVAADTLADFVTGTDTLVVTGTLQTLLEHSGTVFAGVAGAFNIDNDGIFVSTPVAALASGHTFAANNVDLADITAEIGAIAGDTLGDEALFVINDGARVGVYYFLSNGNGAVGAGDTISLITVSAAALAAADITTRIESAASSETISADSDGRVVVVYNALEDSTLGSRDVIDVFDFTTDQIDLSAFALGKDVTVVANDLDGNGVSDNVQFIKNMIPVSVDNATPLTNFFSNALGVDLNADGTNDVIDSAVVVQNEGGTDNYRIFVDLNADGDFVASQDLVFDITNEVSGIPVNLAAMNLLITTADFLFA